MYLLSRFGIVFILLTLSLTRCTAVPNLPWVSWEEAEVRQIKGCQVGMVIKPGEHCCHSREAREFTFGVMEDGQLYSDCDVCLPSLPKDVHGSPNQICDVEMVINPNCYPGILSGSCHSDINITEVGIKLGSFHVSSNSNSNSWNIDSLP